MLHPLDRKIEIKCVVCGKIRRYSPSHAKVRKCCSKTCGYKYLSLNYSGKKSKAGFRNASVKLNCKICGKLFTEFKSRIKDGRGIYCSKQCTFEGQKNYSKGENNPNWLGGRTEENDLFKGQGWWEKLRMKIYTRDNFTCQICGIKCTRYNNKTKIQCDHIIPRFVEENHNEDNLWTLCNSCHTTKDYFLRKEFLYEKRFNY